jgi:hypothetical protein
LWRFQKIWHDAAVEFETSKLISINLSLQFLSILSILSISIMSIVTLDDLKCDYAYGGRYDMEKSPYWGMLQAMPCGISRMLGQCVFGSDLNLTHNLDSVARIVSAACTPHSDNLCLELGTLTSRQGNMVHIHIHKSAQSQSHQIIDLVHKAMADHVTRWVHILAAEHGGLDAGVTGVPVDNTDTTDTPFTPFTPDEQPMQDTMHLSMPKQRKLRKQKTRNVVPAMSMAPVPMQDRWWHKRLSVTQTKTLSAITEAAMPPALSAAVPQAAVPEAAVPEAAVPETAVPETAVPETAVPETAVPETAVPEAAVPEAAVPEVAVPEAAVPEAAVPEAAVFKIVFGTWDPSLVQTSAESMLRIDAPVFVPVSTQLPAETEEADWTVVVCKKFYK